MKLMAGNSNLPLARAIADYLDIPLTDASVRRFADEEIFIEIHENVRGEDLFILCLFAVALGGISSIYLAIARRALACVTTPLCSAAPCLDARRLTFSAPRRLSR